MKKEVLLSAIMLVVTLTTSADEYTDPQTQVVYTYEPGQKTASVKAGYTETVYRGENLESETFIYPGSPNAANDVVILDKFTVGTSEYVVTSIGKMAFRENWAIESVTIPGTVTEIGVSAFALCDNLTTVQLPEGLTKIASSTFRGSKKLASVYIPSSVSEIGACAFDGCSSLATLTLPANITYAGMDAFNGTPWYTAQYNEAPDGPFYIGSLLLGYKGNKPTGELVIKEGTTCVCSGAFKGCNGLTNVTFPASIAYVDNEAFYKCSNLKAVHITDLAAWCNIEFQKEYKSSSNPLFYAHNLYLNGEKVTDLVIPEGVTTIGSYAFDNCYSLNSITIPNGVTSIGTYAFRNCANLISVTLPVSLTTVESWAFISCYNLDVVHIPDIAAWCATSLYWSSPFTYYAHLYLDDKEVTNLVIPEGITSIGSFTFYGCNHLTSVTIPDGVTNIGEYAFFECSGITKVISLIKNPPAITKNVFHNFSSAMLYVPKGCKARYEATAGWKNFKEIVELPDQNNYHPFVENGKEWTMAYLGTVGPEYQHTFSYQQIKLGSAIEVDVMTFKQIVSSSWQYDQDGPSNWKETTEYVGEADGKVYLYNQQTKNTIQVMDFTLKVGDTYRQTLTGDPNDGYWDFVVTAVKDTVIATSADKTPRKCLYLSWSDSKETDDVWIEGIGSLYGGVQGAYGQVKTGAISMLRICKADEQTLYEAYHPFLKEGKTWNYQEYYHNLWDDEQWTKDVSYVINGTTEIDGKTYYKMYRISEEGSEYYCALREEDRKVWQYTSDDGDQLLYDFGMSIGDSYTPSDEPIRYQLTDIKPMRFQYYQLLNVLHYDVSEQDDPTEPYEYIGPEQIVEGVGCEKGWNIMELYAIVPSNGILHGENFLSCYEDGKCIFTADDFNLYETQTKEIEVINDNKAENKKGIYNLQGQRIRHLQKGLNIVNGRKVHVK